MPVRSARGRVAVAFLSLACFVFSVIAAGAQTWPPRMISRTVDVTRISTVDAVEFFSGEQITYQLRGYTGAVTNYAALPTNAVAIWYATDDTYTNYFIVWTNSAQSNATGFLEFVLPTPYSALTAKTYESWVNVYGGTPTNGSTPIGVFDRLQLKVKQNASYAGTYRGPITYTNVTLDGNTYVAPGFWALHAPDINAVITGLAASASSSTTAAFFEVYTTGMVFYVTLTNSWMTVPFSSTGAVFGFSITNGVAYCATPGIFNIDSLLQLNVLQPADYEFGIFINGTLQPQTLYGPLSPSTVYDGPSIVGGLMTLTNGAAVSLKVRANHTDPNPFAVTFSPSTLKGVSTVSALASNVTVNIGGGSGTSTNVVFENLDGNGDVGTGSNQVARGSAVTDEATTRAAADTAIRGELSTASNALTTAIGTKIGASGVTFENADANGDIGTGSNQFARGSAVTTEAVIRATADTQLAGLWQSNRITFAGMTISNVCGWSLNIVYGTNVNSMQSTGCVAYLNIADTNGPAAAGGVATNYVVGFNGTNYSGTGIVFAVGGSITNVVLSNGQIVVQSKDDTAAGSTNTWNVASFPIYNRTDWTGQWAIVESADTFGQTMTLTAWEFRLDGGTQTVDLLDFATTGAYTTNTAALLVVGYTSVVPSVTTLAAGHRLGVKLYDGASWTNRLIGGVRGKP